MPPNPLPEGWNSNRKRPMHGPFFPDWARGRLLWVHNCNFQKWDYARAYGACKICFSRDGHLAQQCPVLKNMKYGDEYVYYMGRESGAPAQ